MVSANEIIVGLDREIADLKRQLAAARDALLNCLCVLEEPGIMDVDEWKAWKLRVESQGRAALRESESQ